MKKNIRDLSTQDSLTVARNVFSKILKREIKLKQKRCTHARNGFDESASMKICGKLLARNSETTQSN